MKNQAKSKNNVSIKLYVLNIGVIYSGIDLSKEISSFDLKIIKDTFHKFYEF